MANSYTQLGFVKQADGENIGTWGDVLNQQLIDLLDDAIGGYVEVSVASGNVTLTFADGTADDNGRHAVIKFTGSPGTSRTVTLPNKQKTYYIINGSDDSVVCTAGTGAETVTLLTGQKDIIYVDGSDEVHSILQEGAVSEKLISSQTAITSGIDSSNDQLLLRDNSASALKKVSIASIFSSVGGLTDVSGDSTPQLGGDLDVNGNDIVTTSNADIDLAPNGTGKVVVKGNSNPGTVVFNCESNSHGQTVKSQPHSASVTNVLTLPAGGDQELVGTTATQTLTNKTLAITSLDIDGGTDIGADLADADLLVVDDGAGGTNRKMAASRIQTYIEGKISGDITISSGTAAIGSGVIVNADINASAAIADSKLATITTANKVGLAALDIDGGSDIGADLTTSDLIIVDDGAGGTNRKAALSRVVTLMSAQGFSQEDPTALAIALG
tara:strand:+ start:16 stop:1341 length:1326 start_codon:yes stop_codon:yes gene_type:complete